MKTRVQITYVGSRVEIKDIDLEVPFDVPSNATGLLFIYVSDEVMCNVVESDNEGTCRCEG